MPARVAIRGGGTMRCSKREIWKVARCLRELRLHVDQLGLDGSRVKSEARAICLIRERQQRESNSPAFVFHNALMILNSNRDILLALRALISRPLAATRPSEHATAVDNTSAPDQQAQDYARTSESIGLVGSCWLLTGTCFNTAACGVAITDPQRRHWPGGDRIHVE